MHRIRCERSSVICDQPQVYPTFRPLLVHKSDDCRVGREAGWSRWDVNLPPGSLGVTGQLVVRAEHGDSFGAGRSFYGEQSQPLTVSGQSVPHCYSASIFIQYKSRVPACDTQVNLFPRAIVSGQRVIHIAVSVTDGVGQRPRAPKQVRPGVHQFLGTGSPGERHHHHQPDRSDRARCRRAAHGLFPNQSGDEVWVQITPLSFLKDHWLPAGNRRSPVWGQNRFAGRILALRKSRTMERKSYYHRQEKDGPGQTPGLHRVQSPSLPVAGGGKVGLLYRKVQDLSRFRVGSRDPRPVP